MLTAAPRKFKRRDFTSNEMGFNQAMLRYEVNRRSCCPCEGMAACGELPEVVENKELNENVDWHAICTTGGAVAHEGAHRPPAGNGDIRGRLMELFRWWSQKSQQCPLVVFRGANMKDNSRKTRFWTVLLTVNSVTLLVPIAFLIVVLLQAEDDPLRLLAILATYGTVFLLVIADTLSICCRYFLDS